MPLRLAAMPLRSSICGSLSEELMVSLGKVFSGKSGGFHRMGAGFRMVGERFVGAVDASLEFGLCFLASCGNPFAPNPEGLPMDA